MRVRAILQPSSLIMIATLATSLLGFGRGLILAKLYGAGPDTDAFFAAMMIPQTIYDYMIGAAVAAVFIPVFVPRAPEDDLWPLAGATTLVTGLILVVLTVTLEFIAPWLMAVLVSGFAAPLHGHTLQHSIRLLRLALPSLAVLGMSTVLTGALYASQRRVAASFSRICLHLGVIAAAPMSAARWGIDGLVAGALAGVMAQLAILVVAALRDGWKLSLPRAHAAQLWQIVRLYVPTAAAGLTGLVVLAVDLNLKARLPAGGDLSSMQYATQVIQFPVGIIIVGLGLAILPSLAGHAQENDETFHRTLFAGAWVTLLLTAPAAVGLCVLAGPISAALFERGAFQAVSTAHTAAALRAYAPQLPLIGLCQVMSLAFFARRNTLIPAMVTAAGAAVYIGIGVLLLGHLTITGLALANTTQFAVQAILLLVLLCRGFGRLPVAHFLRPLFQLGCASALMGVVVAGLPHAMPSQVGPLAELAILIPLASVTYFGALYLTARDVGESQAQWIRQRVTRPRI